MTVVSIYWTGGLDSTYRILYLKCILGVDVQPIYIQGDIDHCVSKRNVMNELNSIQILFKKINKLEGGRLLPVRYIHKPNLSIDTILLSKRLYMLGMIRRPVTQFTYCIEYSNLNQCVIENCTLKTDKLGKYINTLRKYPLLYFLRFPLQYMGKCEILVLSEKRNWLDILKHTVSCWKHIQYDNTCYACRQYQYAYDYVSIKKHYLAELVERQNE